MTNKQRNLFFYLGIPGILALAVGSYFFFRSSPKPTTPPFLPGVYVCVAGNEFCRIDDTLSIHRIGLGSVSYTITHQSAFVRIRQDKRSPPEYQHEEWAATYDPAAQILTASGRTEVLQYIIDQNQLRKNDFIYQKVE
jgi:hypothetical protein